MSTTTMTFNEIKLRVQKSGKCVTCGKRKKRSRTFWQTLNPFNKKEDGTVKTPDDIREENAIRATAWIKEPIDCCNEA